MNRLHYRRALERIALGTGVAFAWWGLSPGVAACAASVRETTTRPGAGHLRHLSAAEMRHITGAQIIISSTLQPGPLVADGAEGAPQPWQGSVGGTGGGLVNPSSMNKLTQLPLVSWSGKGPAISLSLYHNSVGQTNHAVGVKWSHSYNVFLVLGSDPDNPTVQVVEGSGQGSTYVQNIDGTWAAPAGVYDTLVSNSDGTWTLTRKNQVKWKFNAAGFLASITDRNGNSVTLSYDSTNHLQSVTDASGRSLSFTWDSTKTHITGITDPLSRTWTLAYSSTSSSTGNLTSVTEPALGGVSYSTSFGYDSASHITSKTDRRGKVWTFGYASGGDGLSWEKDPLLHETDYATATSGSTQTTTVTDPNSHSTIYTTNTTTGNLASVTDAASHTESYGYDTSHNKTSVTDKRGYSWTYTFDSQGNVLTATDPLSHTTTYTYNATNDLLTTTTQLGNVTTNAYDTHGNCTSVTDPLSHATTLTYNTDGTLATRTDANSHTTSYGYDSYGDPTTVTDALSHTTTTAYDTLGRPTSITTATGLVTSIAYDGWERVHTVTAPGSRTTTFAYDGESHRTGVTNALSQSDSFVYDDAGRLTSHTDGNSHTVYFAYDAAGNKTGFTDGGGHTTGYSYTARNELSGITYPDSTSESYSYLETGQPYTITDGRGITKTQSYDHAGRLTGWSYSDGGVTPSVSLGYDNDDRRTSLVDGTGTTSYGYDDASRLTSRITPQGTITFGYDDANRLTSRTVSSGTTTLGYDSADRLTSVSAPGASGTETTSYAYDNDNRLTTTTLASGSVETRGYDAAKGDLTGISRAASLGGTTVSSFSYAYDALGRKTSETLLSGEVTSYGYDNAGQLTSESRTGTSSGYTLAYVYDGAGNRTSRTLNGTTTENYTYDSANKLLTAGVKSYSYDNAGNTTSITNSSTGVTTTLTWDAEERVTAVTSTAGLSNGYAYNGLDQRKGKTDSTGTFSYLRESDAVDAPVLSDGAASYTHGLGLISEVRGGASKFYQADALGSTRELTDASGATTDTHSTDAFGNTVTGMGSTPTPFGFVGQAGYQSDSDTGLMLLGHRLYDSSTGRFLSRDPVRDGDNWYAYCGNDPVNGKDPKGEFIVAIILVVIAVACILDQTATPAGEPNPSYAPDPPPSNDLLPLLPGPYGAVVQVGAAVGTSPPNLTPIGAGRNGAFRAAKRSAGIPVSQQPESITENIDRRGNTQPGENYNFRVPTPGGGSEFRTIRNDSGGHDYGPGDPQNRGPHFNDPDGGHFDYPGPIPEE